MHEDKVNVCMNDKGSRRRKQDMHTSRHWKQAVQAEGSSPRSASCQHTWECKSKGCYHLGCSRIIYDNNSMHIALRPGTHICIAS
jgi:hypothetical protein